MSDLQFSVETLDPITCAMHLQHNIKNRKTKQRHIERMSLAMKDGNWRLNGEPIIFNGDGTLLDGQQRLMACIRSNTPFTTVVIRGIDTKAFSSLNTGSKRTLADVLSIEREENYCTIAGALNWMWKYERSSCNTGDNIPTHEGLRLLEEHPGMRQVSRTVSRLDLLITPGMATFTRYMMLRDSPELAELFFNRLCDGVGLKKGDPVYLLRERLIQNRASKAKLPQFEILALVIKAWNATKKGETLRFLRFRNKGDQAEEFPSFAE